MPVHNLTIPPDVAAVLGGSDRFTALLAPRMDYRCITCRAFGSLGDEPVEVTAVVHPDATLAKFVHRRCGRGQVVRRGGKVPYPEEGLDIWAVPAVASTPFGHWAVLVVEKSMVTLSREQPRPGEEADEELAVWSQAGMSPAGSIFGAPPPGDSWQVRMPGGRHPGAITHLPTGLLLMDRLTEVGFPAGWAEAAAARGGQCGLYMVSRVAVRPAATDGGDGAFSTAIEAAGKSGRMIGTTAAVVGLHAVSLH